MTKRELKIMVNFFATTTFDEIGRSNMVLDIKKYKFGHEAGMTFITCFEAIASGRTTKAEIIKLLEHHDN